jgi:hypothetical protein
MHPGTIRNMSILQEIEAAILGLSEQDRLHLADK